MRIRIQGALAAIALLSACGAMGNAEPGRDDMQAAMVRYMMGENSNQIDKDTIWLSGKAGYRQFINVQKIACAKGGDAPGFKCDFSLESCIGNAANCPLTTVTSSGRFVKGEKDWQFVADESVPEIQRPVLLVHDLQTSSWMNNGGAVHCFAPGLEGRAREVALHLGGKPCAQ